MDIIRSELAFSAERSYSRTRVSQETLRLEAARTSPRNASGNDAGRVSISPDARRLASIPQAPSSTSLGLAEPGDDSMLEALSSAEEAARNDPNLRFLIELIEAFTGRPLRLDGQMRGAANEPASSSEDPAASVPAGDRPAVSLEYRRSEVLQESELTRFHAQGVVRTADGREIQFELALEMERHYREVSSTRLSVGAEPPRKDPLVLNFAGTAAELRDQRFEFDLDSDGRTESLAQLGSGSGFLVFDRNGNGRADDGSELFGAKSGDGFADLARLDGDGNGWIDAGDAAFAKLRLWTPTSNDGGRWSTLAEHGVEAIATANIATEFGLRGQGNRDLGQIRATGIYLGSAGVGTAQQVDLTV